MNTIKVFLICAFAFQFSLLSAQECCVSGTLSTTQIGCNGLEICINNYPGQDFCPNSLFSFVVYNTSFFEQVSGSEDNCVVISGLELGESYNILGHISSDDCALYVPPIFGFQLDDDCDPNCCIPNIEAEVIDCYTVEICVSETCNDEIYTVALNGGPTQIADQSSGDDCFTFQVSNFNFDYSITLASWQSDTECPYFQEIDFSFPSSCPIIVTPDECNGITLCVSSPEGSGFGGQFLVLGNMGYFGFQTTSNNDPCVSFTGMDPCETYTIRFFSNGQSGEFSYVFPPICRVDCPDFNDSFGSKEIELRSEKNESFEINLSPNPFIDLIQLEHTSASNSELSLTMFDLKGSVLLQESYEVTKGNNRLLIDTDAKLPAGVYFLRATDGVSAVTKKIVKQ